MPTAPARPCPAVGCPQFQPCPTHQSYAGRLQRTPWRGLYRTARWQRLRAAVLADEPLCRMCAQQDRVTAASHVDHVIPHRGDETRMFDRANLQPLCARCHSAKTLAESRA